MQKLFEMQQMMLSSLESMAYFDRALFQRITLDNHITGIVGARGVGKTTLLLKKAMESGAKEQRALYVSADNIFFLDNELMDVVDRLYKETDVRLLCLDEVHKYPNWQQVLKNIVDTYHGFKILFSGSSAIDITHSQYDLSRRVTLHHLHGLSFREYLAFYFDKSLPLFSLKDIIENHRSIIHDIQIPQLLKCFNDYLRVGYYPFFKQFSEDWEKFHTIENSIQKVIYEDIASLHKVQSDTLMLIEKLYKYIVISLPGEVSAYKLSSTLQKDFKSVSTYLRYLEQAGIIRFLYSKKGGKAYLRNPTKLYPENTNVIYGQCLPQAEDVIHGKVRETFLLSQLQNAGYAAYYSEQGDFAVENYTFEVGGKNKTRAQIKNVPHSYVLNDGILVGTKGHIPLYLLGFLY